VQDKISDINTVKIMGPSSKPASEYAYVVNPIGIPKSKIRRSLFWNVLNVKPVGNLGTKVDNDIFLGPCETSNTIKNKTGIDGKKFLKILPSVI